MAGYLGSVPVPQATQHRETFTATAGQTTFNTAGYTPLFVDVYLNGVHLSPADITATNGSDVVLGACVVNDIVDIVSYTPFEVASQTFTGTTTMDVASVGGTLGVTGVVTANAGVVVDNITIDGTEIDLSSGDLTLDVAGDINLDADGGDINLKDGGTAYAHLSNSSSDLFITNPTADKDIHFRGNDSDGGGFISALTLDMSDAGTATFNHDVKATGNFDLPNANTFITGAGHNVVQVDSTRTYFYGGTNGVQFRTADNASENITFSNTGAAVFNEQGNDADFRIESNNNANMLLVDASTDRVGIGRAAPASIFEVHMDTNKNIGFSGGQGELGSVPALVAYTDAGSLADIGFRGTTVRFANSSAEVMRIASNGDIGIGKSSPGNPGWARNVHIHGSGNGGGLKLTDTTSGSGNNDGFDIASYQGTAFIINRENTDIRFHTNDAEKMRLDSSGNLLIGGTNANPIGNHVPQVMLAGAGGSHFHRDDGVAVKIGRNDANECTEFFRNGASQGGISLTSSGVTYNSDSDYRLKENVTYTWDATTKLKQLKPAQFNFIAVPDETMNGFLAHEVQAVVSDAVSGVKDAVDGDGNIKAQRIDHSRLVPLLVKTIQELEARIATLEG